MILFPSRNFDSVCRLTGLVIAVRVDGTIRTTPVLDTDNARITYDVQVNDDENGGIFTNLTPARRVARSGTNIDAAQVFDLADVQIVGNRIQVIIPETIVPQDCP